MEIPKSHNPIITFEGLDGSGKTTISRLMAQQLEGFYTTTTEGHILTPFRSLFDNSPTQIRYLYYLISNLITYPHLENLRKSGPVFLDRGLPSTLAYHRADGLPSYWLKLVPSFLLHQSDNIVYLTATTEERLARLYQRASTTSPLTATDIKSINRAPQIDQSYRDIFQAFFPNRVLYMSTDNKTPQEVVDQLKTELAI